MSPLFYLEGKITGKLLKMDYMLFTNVTRSRDDFEEKYCRYYEIHIVHICTLLQATKK